MSATCTFHPKVETALTCTHCDRPACPDCLTPVAVGQHCDGCLKGRAAPGDQTATAKVRAAVAGRDDYQRLRRPSLAFYLVAALFVACCVGAWLVEPARPGSETTAARAAALAIVVSGALLGLVFHEWAHAIVAYAGGDKSVADKGYLTMDVRHYSHPLLSIGMPLVFLLMGGLPLPGGMVWIERGRLRSKWWDSAVSLAGPAINFVGALALYGIVETGVFGDHLVLSSALGYLAYLEVAIVILNLLPIPGLDGYGVLEPHLSPGLRHTLAPLRQYSLVLLLIFVTSPASDFIMQWAMHVEHAIGVNRIYGDYGEALANPRLT